MGRFTQSTLANEFSKLYYIVQYASQQRMIIEICPL